MVMFKVNVFEVKAKLSEYLDRAARGERIVICRHNRPVAELRAIEEARTEPRPIGPLPGRPTFDIPPAFFKPLGDEELELWEGGALFDEPGTAGGASRGHGDRVAEGNARRGTGSGRRAGKRRS